MLKHSFNNFFIIGGIFMSEYSRDRSKLWVKVFDEDHINISANSMTKGLLKRVSPKLINYSPKGWKESKNYKDIFNLWIPKDWIDDFCLLELERIETWADHANQHIWLGTNSYTQAYFSGEEVDYCIAADWNMYFGTGKHTAIGEAEYQLKYNLPRGILDKEDAEEFANTLVSAICDCAACLPFNLRNFVVTAIPATKENQCKLAWELAKCTANEVGAPFMEATLTQSKPQMKEKSISDKIRIWRKILADEDMLELSHKVEKQKVLIVDDLYQSGASIWCFAEFLKKVCGAKKVMAITSVKALKDGDNQ